MDSVLYTLPETIHKQNYIIASYHIRLPKEADILKKADHWDVDSDSGNYGGDSGNVYGKGGKCI